MLAALAGVVRDCQRADDHEHNRGEDNYFKGVFIANLPCPFRKSYPRVAMMQPGKDWYGDDTPGSLDGSP